MSSESGVAFTDYRWIWSVPCDPTLQKFSHNKFINTNFVWHSSSRMLDLKDVN
jgi:hypothetical protein